jgi:hypothetical protein
MSVLKTVILTMMLMVGACAQAATRNQAMAILVVPPVEWSRDQVVYRPLKQGMTVSPGTTVRTGKGMLTLLFSDGSQVGLKSDSVLTITKSQYGGETTHTWLSLAKGFARALVHKMSKGSDFQVQTTNAVAAVKGTDFETGYGDGGDTTVKVFSTEGAGVQLSDLTQETTTLVKENQAGTLNSDGTLDQPHTMTEAEKAAALSGYSGMNLTNPNGGTGGSPEPTAAATTAATAAPTAAPTVGTTGGTAVPTVGTTTGGTGPTSEPTVSASVDLGKQITNAVSDLQSSLAVSGQTEQAAQSTDAFLGNNLVDRHGYRVQVSRYIVRSTNASNQETVAKVSLTQRTDGPQAGVSRFENDFTYNKVLPFDWTTVANQPLNAAGNLDPVTGQPIYYQVKAGFTVSNPAGEQLCNCRTYDVPVPVGSGLYGQASSIYYNVDHHNVGYQDFNAPTAAQVLAGQMTGTWKGLGIGGDDISTVVTPATAANPVWHVDFVNNSTASTMFSEDVALLDGNGATQDMTAILSNPAQLRDFSLINKPVAVSLTVSAPSWNGNSVDLLLLPDFLTSDF